MKAAIVHSATSGASYGDFAEPSACDGRKLVRMVAAGIHPVVRALAAGQHYGGSGNWPLVPGVDAVVESSDGALAYTGLPEPPFGTLAERISVPSFLWVALPSGTDAKRVAAGVNPGMASWSTLENRRSETGSLGTVLILGVTGMAGYLAAQNAIRLGASHVVGIGRNPATLATVERLGVDTISLTDDAATNLDAIRDLIETDCPSTILDFLWGPVAEVVFAALERRGFEEDTGEIAYIQIGASAGSHARMPAALLRSRKVRVTGSGAGSACISELLIKVQHYIPMIADGLIDVPVRTFPLSKARDAWEAAHKGLPRVVIVPD